MGYIVHRILQARILEWVASPFSKGFSQPRDWTQVSCIAGRFFTRWATRGTQSTKCMTFIAQTTSPPYRPILSAAKHLGDVRTLAPRLSPTSIYPKEILLYDNASVPLHFSSPTSGRNSSGPLKFGLCLLMNGMPWMPLGRRNSRRWDYSIKAAMLGRRMHSGKGWFTWK